MTGVMELLKVVSSDMSGIVKWRHVRHVNLLGLKGGNYKVSLLFGKKSNYYFPKRCRGILIRGEPRFRGGDYHFLV